MQINYENNNKINLILIINRLIRKKNKLLIKYWIKYKIIIINIIKIWTNLIYNKVIIDNNIKIIINIMYKKVIIHNNNINKLILMIFKMIKNLILCKIHHNKIQIIKKKKWNKYFKSIIYINRNQVEDN